MKLVKTDIKNQDVLIIEANESGGKVTIQNYIIYQRDSLHVDIDKYSYLLNRNWFKIDSVRNLTLTANTNLKRSFVEFGSGFNNNDVIITHVKNDNIQNSEYFLFSTLFDIGFKSILNRK